MVDSGTLATTAQVLLAIGQNASAAQILEANTNYWIEYAEAEMSIEADNDLVANVGSLGTNFVQYIAVVAASRAAIHAINQDQNVWGLATTQSKLNILDSIWSNFIAKMKEPREDIIALMGL